jgi:stearoyl-CoA desaturase (delta-9 desaturase)
MAKKIDMSDMSADPWIMFQKKYYKIWYTIFALLLPTSVPIIFWNEDPFVALMVAYFARTILNLNATWLVNSAAHLYGTRPFDNTMLPVESMFVALLAVGEGWHNYHHVFPWDYRASEMGSPLNLTTTFIDWLAKYGVIYDRREATTDMVKNRVLKSGDGSHHKYGNEEARKQVKTWFNIWKHPLNPTYTNINQPVPKKLLRNGYALGDEELDVREKSAEILKRENEILLQKRMKEKLDENGNIFDGNNNENHSNHNGGHFKGKKNSLNATKIN